MIHGCDRQPVIGAVISIKGIASILALTVDINSASVRSRDDDLLLTLHRRSTTTHTTDTVTDTDDTEILHVIHNGLYGSQA